MLPLQWLQRLAEPDGAEVPGEHDDPSGAGWGPKGPATVSANVACVGGPMAADTLFFAEGGCTCRAVRYGITTKPLFVHCCHCRWCQRETGTSYALNALIESDRVIVRAGAPETVNTPSASGKGQQIL